MMAAAATRPGLAKARMDQWSVRQLLEAARGGDRVALDRLVARHEPQVQRFALRLCANEQDARDVMQETLLALLTGVGDFRQESELSTWLFRVVRNLSARSRRRRVREPLEFDRLDESATAFPSEESAPSDAVESRQLGRAVSEAILSLPDAQREAVVLRDFEELTAEEAARVTGLDISAHKSRLYRGRLNLKKRLTTMLANELE